jgi:hypothetical protein
MKKVKWDDLSRAKQHAIEQMARGPYLMLTTQMAERLKELGLAEGKLGSTGLNRAGRQLYAERVATVRKRRGG